MIERNTKERKSRTISVNETKHCFRKENRSKRRPPKKKTTNRERGEEEKRDMGESDGGRESDEHKKR